MNPGAKQNLLVDRSVYASSDHTLYYRTYIGLLSAFLRTENEKVSFIKVTLYLALDCSNRLLAVGSSTGTSYRVTDGSYTYSMHEAVSNAVVRACNLLP